MAINRHLLHVKSNQTVTTTVDNEDVTRAKLPSPSNIEHGEIAINYHDGYETISIKNDNNEIVEFPNLNAVNILINEAMSGAQDALTFDETPTENSTNPVTSEGIKEYVDTGDSIQSLTTYQSSTPLAVGDTHDQALSKLSKIIDDNETVVARALTELEDTKADKDDLYTKDEVDSLIEETNDSLTQIIEDNELTIATALNDLDSRISNMKGSIEELNEPSESTPLAVGDTYDDAFAKLTKIIRDDEEITARALTDLNETKQDEITDLDTIRSGAALGATALQSETQLSKGTATGDGNVVTDIAVNNHQITLTMGLTALTENALKTVNSLSLIGSGNIDAEDVILGKLELVTETLPRIGEVSSWKFFRFLGTYTQVTEGMLRYEEPDFSSTAETPDDEKIYVDILTYKIYWYDGSSTILTNENDTLIKFKELGGVDLSSYADGAEYDSNEKKIYLKHGATRLSNPIDATDFIKDGMVNSVRIDTLDDGSSDDGSDGYEAKYLIITFNTDAGMEDIEIPLSDIFDPSLYYTKEEIDEHELVTAAALTELHNTKQDLLAFDSTPTANSTNPVTSDGIYTALDDKQDALTFDSTPTANSENPVTSQGIKTYVDTAIGDISNEIEELEEPLVSTPLAVGDTYDEAFAKLTKIIRDNELATAGVLTELHDTKQDSLTFDETPTALSNNPVTSNGIVTALSGKKDKDIELLSSYSNLLTEAQNGNESSPVTLSATALAEYNDLASKYGSGESFTFFGAPTVIDPDNFTMTNTMTFNTLTVGYIAITCSIYTDGNNGYWADIVENKYQEELTFDSTPTANSTNPVTSGGVYAALSNVNTDHLTEVTYSELKTLRDDSELVPGMFYRITDYQCTTTQKNTKSAGHQFDIILLALSENKLAEEGWAMEHPTDVYDVTFRGGEIKKCYVAPMNEVDGAIYYNIVDIDTLLGYTEEGPIIDEKAKTVVSSYTVDSLRQELPYNYFQNSNLSAWKVWYCLDNDTSRFAWADDRIYVTIHSDNEDYAWANGIKMMRNEDGDGDWEGTGSAYAWIAPDELGEYFTNNETPQHGDILYYGDGTETGYIVDKLGINGTGVIYRLIDEFNNDIKYDFKNIQFKRTITDGQYDVNGTETWCYTLNVWYQNMCQDASVIGNTLINDEDYVVGVYKNKFGTCTEYDVYGGSGNTLKFRLGNNVVLSIDDDDDGYYGISSNMIGNKFFQNTIGNNFNYNTIGNNFNYNTIGNDFHSNTIGNDFNYNTIGNNFNSNTIGNNFFQNTIGNNFYSNTIGNNFFQNTIGTRNGNTVTTIDYVRYIRVEDGVQYVDITTSAITSSSAYLQNITISQGIAGTSSSSRKTITHPTVGDTFKTTYQSANSQVFSI